MPEQIDSENAVFNHLAGVFEARIWGIDPANCATVQKSLGDLAPVIFCSSSYELEEARSRAIQALRMSLDWQKPDGEI